eukprot:2570435-Rhodomonas_salina.1
MPLDLVVETQAKNSRSLGQLRSLHALEAPAIPEPVHLLLLCTEPEGAKALVGHSLFTRGWV